MTYWRNPTIRKGVERDVGMKALPKFSQDSDGPMYSFISCAGTSLDRQVLDLLGSLMVQDLASLQSSPWTIRKSLISETFVE
eukprot:6157439-Heterocapsa_arctica.AAC.1